MTKVDLIALGFVALTAFIGWKKGLVASALSVAGIVLGAWLGSRLAPELLQGGTSSPYTPLAALAGAAVGAILLETLGTLAGHGAALADAAAAARRRFDSAGGLVLGAVAGPRGRLGARRGRAAAARAGGPPPRRAEVGAPQRLNEVVRPRSVLNALARIDPFPAITGPRRPSHRPTRGSRARPACARRRRASCACSAPPAASVSRVPGGPRARALIVTAAHVVAGQEDTIVELQSGHALPADVVAFDPRNDIAVLRVDGLGLRPLPLVAAKPGAAVAVLGFPENGPFTATPARIGRTSVVLAEDAYGTGPVTRAITSLARPRAARRLRRARGRRRGAVESTVFAARLRSAAATACRTTSCVRRSTRGAAGLDRRLRALASSSSSTRSGRRNGATR